MEKKTNKPEHLPLREGYQPIERGYRPSGAPVRPVPPQGGTGVVNAPTASVNGNKPPR